MSPPNPGFAYTRKQHIQQFWYTYHQMNQNTGYTGSDFDIKSFQDFMDF